MDQIQLSLVIPVYNEEENVKILLEKIYETFKESKYLWELIVIDDGSQDNTSGCLKQYADNEKVRIIQFQRNFGQTAAMQAGIDLARGEFIVTLDGDLQNDPTDIDAMIERMNNENLDLLCGWRKNRKDPFVRKIASQIANKMIGCIIGLKLNDYGCSLKVYRASIIKNVKLYGQMHRFIPVWATTITSPSRVKEHIVNHHPREYGKSKYGFSRVLPVLIDIIFLFFLSRYYKRPGHFLGFLGLLFIVSSLLLSLMPLFLIWKFIFSQLFFTIVFLFAMGCQFIAIGIIAEIAIRIYYNHNKSYHIKYDSWDLE